MENARKCVDMRLVPSKDNLSKLTVKPTFISSNFYFFFNENVVAARKTRKRNIDLEQIGICRYVYSRSQ